MIRPQWASLRSRPAVLPLPRIRAIATSSSSSTPSSSSSTDAPSQLSARERRQLRNERRESLSAAGGGWREEVEERLLRRRKKSDKPSWKEELNLDNLALLGPQWWVVRVSRVNGHETAERLARRLAAGFPLADFKVYHPAVKVKRKLKNGSVSVKPKPIYPGCAFLHCVLNKEIHDFVREVDGVGGFLGSKVGNSKRQINKPKPVGVGDMEEIFKQAKREQELHDLSFEEEEAIAAAAAGEKKVEQEGLRAEEKPKSRTKRSSGVKISKSNSEDPASLLPGKNVRFIAGSFVNYVGLLKKIDPKAGMATVGIMMFGKETIVDVDCEEIVAEAL
ncbi:plastid transcriptionally active 13 [Wolffia australiana]